MASVNRVAMVIRMVPFLLHQHETDCSLFEQDLDLFSYLGQFFRQVSSQRSITFTSKSEVISVHFQVTLMH